MILVEGSQAFPVRLSDGGLHKKHAVATWNLETISALPHLMLM
jgi:hypothetical protein